MHAAGGDGTPAEQPEALQGSQEQLELEGQEQGVQGQAMLDLASCEGQKQSGQQQEPKEGKTRGIQQRVREDAGRG